jgi:hypothetical protein
MGIFSRIFRPNVEKLKRKEAGAGLIKALRHEEWKVRKAAAEALGELEDESAIEALSMALEDDQEQVRHAANSALRKIRKGMVSLTFTVALPPSTPHKDSVYIAGDFNQWNPKDMSLERENLIATTTLLFREGTTLEYKYTRGSWEAVEKGESCEEISNRTLTIRWSNDGSQDQHDSVGYWSDEEAIKAETEEWLKTRQVDKQQGAHVQSEEQETAMLSGPPDLGKWR